MCDVRSRDSWYKNLQRLQAKVNTLDPAKATDSEVQSFLESAEQVWRKIDTHHTKLLSAAADDDAATVQMTALEPMEDCYLDIKSKLYSLKSSSTGAPRHRSNVRLPDMELPTFDGKFEDWPTFQDLFLASVHRNTWLSGSQKLQYLKSCTRGEAASLIKSFTVTDANYAEAWQLLENQYDNQREIVHSHIKKLLFQPSIKAESPSSLQQMLTTTLESIRSLKVLGRPTDQWDDLVTVILVEKFDGDTKAEWAKSLKGTDPPTFQDLQDFITQHIRTLHARGSMKQTSTRQQPSNNQPSKIRTHHASSPTCQFCKDSHFLYQCAKLKDMTSEDRFNAVRGTGVCTNCLAEGHSSKTCRSPRTCRKCGHKHNTFLHMDSKVKTSNPPQSKTQPTAAAVKQDHSSSSSLKINSSSFSSSSPTLLKTALADVRDNGNVKRTVRVFIDEGGEGSLIRESTMHQLGLAKHNVNITITGVGGSTVAKSKFKTFVRLFSQIDNSSIDVELFAVPRVTGVINHLPQSSNRSWSHIAGLQLADPYYHTGGEIDILLGSNVAPYILKQGLKKLDTSSPVAQETIFGWVLFGNVEAAPQQHTFNISNFKCEINSLLRRFWELEEVPSQSSLTTEEAACEQHFLSTHTRQPDGRYMVRLPFNNNKEFLGDSRDQAFRRLLSLERRFKRQPEYRQAYIDFMRDYEHLGHMEKVNSSVNKVSKTFYLPHHFVLKADSTTTKQRTVFDGSAKSSSGISLNDSLLVGATVQSDLFTLLLGFRYNSIALKADIGKMYRQFIVHEDDRDYQRILWREDSSQEIQEYRLTTVTYGTSCAPFLATRALNQLAMDEKKFYPAASKALLTSTYVDDFLGVAGSQTEAIELINQMIHITASAGMEIRKWCSNDPSVLCTVPENLKEECNFADFDEASSSSTSVKALGIKWQPSTDEFMFTVNVDTTAAVTKRHILSEISKTFDPLGWLSPITINAKLLLQKVWLEGSDWDTTVSSQLQNDWDVYVHNLEQVKNIKIPRCVINSTPLQIELHGYSDSSELAYSCCIYVKCTYVGGATTVKLLTSRTRVAPIKHVSLPKLELCGAVLLAETMDVVRKSFPHHHQLYCWSDSTIALRWISSHSRKWKTFVANRVSTIQTLIPPEHWRHVRSEDNPADLPSRGITTDQLINSSLWWHGPSWLLSSSYPISTASFNEEEVKKEERTKQLACFHLASQAAHNQLFSAFSSLQKLLRCTSYIIRFLQFLKSKKQIINKNDLTVKELHSAKQKLIVWCQAVSFPEDLHSLNKHSKLTSSSKLQQLTPVIDSTGILRVGGRLQNAQLSSSTRHPIILPHNHHLTQLIIAETHLINLHSGFTLTFATLRRQYWILRGRDTVRHHLRRCITCRRAKAATTTQLMGNLPTGRINPSRPFFHAGVDFAGPFQTKLKKGRHFAVAKCYFAIFVCLATKAVHLEAVNSLSSDAFIACYERFVSRRGISAHIYSDCGTNFVGANRILQEFLQHQQSHLQHQFTTRGTTWHFNPPSSPHQG